MSKSFKVAVLAGAMTMALGGMASAAAVNFQYDGWSAAGGQIDETAGGMCADAAYTCSVVASGSGFKQINVTEVADASSGTSYIMTIVTDQDATGSASTLGFTDVSFVRMKLTLGGASGNGESGITAKQTISDGKDTGKSFLSTTSINTGWAATAGAANIVIAQDLDDDGGTAGFTGDNFSSGFSYESRNDAVTGKVTGFEMAIDQTARLANGATLADGVTVDPSINDIQVFALREKQGSYVTASNATGVNVGGTPVTWTGESAGVTGDDIKAMWIGQEINLGATAGAGTGSLGSSFGYVSFENVKTQVKDSAFGFASTNSQSAWTWDSAFYTDTEIGAPTLAGPTLAP